MEINAATSREMLDYLTREKMWPNRDWAEAKTLVELHGHLRQVDRYLVWPIAITTNALEYFLLEFVGDSNVVKARVRVEFPPLAYPRFLLWQTADEALPSGDQLLGAFSSEDEAIRALNQQREVAL